MQYLYIKVNDPVFAVECRLSVPACDLFCIVHVGTLQSWSSTLPTLILVPFILTQVHINVSDPASGLNLKPR